jgi:lipoate-protein ligase A
VKDPWRIIDSGPSNAHENMAIDEAISVHTSNGTSPPTIRLYSWDNPSISIGCFQKLLDINIKICNELSIPVTRRPTGGRAILHCSEITYSFSAQYSDHPKFDNLMNTYNIIATVFLSAFKALDLDVRIKPGREKGKILTKNPHCFKAVSFGELVVEDRKIIGSAQKRFRTGFLQQGSIPFELDSYLYHKVFRDAINPVGLSDLYQDIDEKDLKAAILSSFENVFNKELIKGHLTEDESLLARKLLFQKYRSPDWIQRR